MADMKWIPVTERLPERGTEVLVREPFLLDDELREKALRWVEWANKADPSEYDPFARRAEDGK